MLGSAEPPQAAGDRPAEVAGHGPPYRLAVLILTQDEERNLPACLASLAGLEAEVYVVDSGSADSTVALAGAAGATVWRHEFTTYGRQRNWGQERLPGGVDWVLHLDADERLTPELVAEINEVTRDGPGEVMGFMLRKRTYFLGRWMRHGAHYPSYHLRLFRPAAGRCEERLYDQHFVVTGRVDQLRNDYLDVVASDLTTWSQRHLRWAAAEAAEVRQPTHRGVRVQPRLRGTPIERRRWLREELYYRAPPFWRPVAYFGYRYLVRLGFLDGPEGFLFHFLQGLWLRVMIDAEIWTGEHPVPDGPAAGSPAGKPPVAPVARGPRGAPR